jgi:hypothetical protein
MKSAALELGSYGITVNAVIPGLIDTVLTRHEDRYAQAIGSGRQEPTGDLSRDEETAKKLLTAKSPLGVPWIDPAAAGTAGRRAGSSGPSSPRVPESKPVFRRRAGHGAGRAHRPPTPPSRPSPRAASKSAGPAQTSSEDGYLFL